MSVKRFLALQSLFYAFANGIEALVPFLLAPILTRSLDPTEYGIWVLFITYATFLRPFVGLTSQDAIRMRFYDFNRKQLDQFTHTIFFVMTLIMIFSTILVFLFRDVLAVVTKFPSHWLVSITITAFLFEVFYTALALFQFHERRLAFLYTQIAQAGLSLGCITAFLVSGWDWRGVILGRMLGMVSASVVSLWSLGYKPSVFFTIPPRSYYRSIAHFGLFYWPSGMVVMAMALIDKMVAVHFISVAAGAFYGVAALFASAFWILNNSFILAWTPWLFRKLKKASGDETSEIVSVSLLYFVVSTVVAGAIYLLSLWIAPLFLGEKFQQAVPLLPYIMGVILLQGFFMHNMKFLHFEKKILIMSAISFSAIVMNTFLSILWAPEMGVEGIMLATAASFGVTFLISGVVVVSRFSALQKGVNTVV